MSEAAAGFAMAVATWGSTVCPNCKEDLANPTSEVPPGWVRIHDTDQNINGKVERVCWTIPQEVIR